MFVMKIVLNYFSYQTQELLLMSNIAVLGAAFNLSGT